jgi:hypothetical protein
MSLNVGGATGNGARAEMRGGAGAGESPGGEDGDNAAERPAHSPARMRPVSAKPRSATAANKNAPAASAAGTATVAAATGSVSGSGIAAVRKARRSEGAPVAARIAEAVRNSRQGRYSEPALDPR